MTGAGDKIDHGEVVVQFPVRVSRTELANLLAATELKGSSPPLGSEEVLPARDKAVRLLKLRRRREAELGETLFADPAWDILLDLFVRAADGRRTSVSSACIGSAVPSTTALRHLSVLIDAGLVARVASERDHRVHYVKLTERAQAIMLRLLTE